MDRCKQTLQLSYTELETAYTDIKNQNDRLKVPDRELPIRIGRIVSWDCLTITTPMPQKVGNSSKTHQIPFWYPLSVFQQPQPPEHPHSLRRWATDSTLLCAGSRACLSLVRLLAGGAPYPGALLPRRPAGRGVSNGPRHSQPYSRGSLWQSLGRCHQRRAQRGQGH